VKRWWVGSLAMAAMTVTLPALADPPATAGAVQLGLGFRYGFEMNDGDFNPWGPGLGLDIGYTLPNALYLGANAEYFFGETVDVEGLGELKGNVWQVTAEVGYDLGLGDRVVIRPKVGLGVASLNSESCVDLGSDEVCTDDSSTNFAATPGVDLLYLGEHFSLTVDVRYDLIFADPTAKAVLLSVGFGF